MCVFILLYVQEFVLLVTVCVQEYSCMVTQAGSLMIDHHPQLMGPRTCIKTFCIGDTAFLGYQIKMNERLCSCALGVCVCVCVCVCVFSVLPRSKI